MKIRRSRASSTETRDFYFTLPGAMARIVGALTNPDVHDEFRVERDLAGVMLTDGVVSCLVETPRRIDCAPLGDITSTLRVSFDRHAIKGASDGVRGIVRPKLRLLQGGRR